jgi:hypothetical protein
MVSDQHYDTANAIFAFSLSLGWVAAFVAGAFPIEDLLPSTLFPDSVSAANRHIEVLIVSSPHPSAPLSPQAQGVEGAVVILCVVAACWRGTKHSSVTEESAAGESSSSSRPLIALCLLQFSGCGLRVQPCLRACSHAVPKRSSSSRSAQLLRVLRRQLVLDLLPGAPSPPPSAHPLTPCSSPPSHPPPKFCCLLWA